MSGRLPRVDHEESSILSAGAFPRTRWTLVVAAADQDVAAAGAALEEICENYWQPIYDFLRGSGNKPEDAEDLTQGFFAHIVSEETLSHARRERGRLRTFMLAAL